MSILKCYTNIQIKAKLFKSITKITDENHKDKLLNELKLNLLHKRGKLN